MFLWFSSISEKSIIVQWLLVMGCWLLVNNALLMEDFTRSKANLTKNLQPTTNNPQPQTNNHKLLFHKHTAWTVFVRIDERFVFINTHL